MINYAFSWILPTTGNPYSSKHKFSRPISDYCRFVNEFFIEGHRFVHKNMVLTLFRLLRAGDMPQQNPLTALPTLESLKPLDVSGAFVLEACVRIDDRTKPNLVSTASDELGAFRDLMKGSIDMKVPERLSLDTRVR